MFAIACAAVFCALWFDCCLVGLLLIAYCVRCVVCCGDLSSMCCWWCGFGEFLLVCLLVVCALIVLVRHVRFCISFWLLVWLICLLRFGAGLLFGFDCRFFGVRSLIICLVVVWGCGYGCWGLGYVVLFRCDCLRLFLRWFWISSLICVCGFVSLVVWF